ncbi:MAG: NUDIX hydrolase [Candidatus Promineifilaceae bacterium]
MNSIELLQRDTVYQDQWLQIRKDTFRKQSQLRSYTIVERAHSVIIVPLLPDNQTILLRQYRYPVEDYSWELPMGGINPGESDEAAALRELQEETHLTATSLKRLAVYYPVPGLTPQKATVFTAAINPSIPLDLSPFGADDIHERQVISLTKVDQMILDGIIRDGFTLAGWLFFKLSRTANFSENSPH